MYECEVFPISCRNQTDKALYLLRLAGKRGVTCSEFLQTSLAAEYRARISDLRGEGYVIDCELHRGGKSIYRLIEIKKEPNGQFAFA